MASKNDNPLDQIGGFFEALFGACMGEDRKVDKKKDDTRPPQNASNNILGKLFSAFPDSEEISGIGQDWRQMSGMVRHREGGIGSEISGGLEYFVGQKPPGFFTDLLDVITGETPSYALPLSQDQRFDTVRRLKQFSEENSSNNLYGLSQSAEDIANNLEKSDNFGYRYSSLASAADAAGLTKEKIKAIYKIIKKSHAEEEAKDLASDLRQNPQNKQLFSLGFSGSSPADNLHPQSNQRSPFSHNGFGAGAAGFRGIHRSRFPRNGARAGVRGGPNYPERR